jgi:uncharacterized protein (TIGR02246 family)
MNLPLESTECLLRDLHSTWIAAVNAGDLARLLTLMTDDVVFLNPGQAPFGREGFTAAFSAAHHRLRLHCVSDLNEVVVAGEIAYTRSHDTLSASPHLGGEQVRLAGDRLTVYRRQPDGRWLLARDAHTLSPVKQ